MAKVGRPSKKTPEICADICVHLAEGRSLVSWCQIDGNVKYATVLEWLKADEDFAGNYARARQDQADRLAEEILDIADESSNDTYTDEDGNEQTNHEVVARSRLRIDARKWYAGKLRPKVYGDRILQEHSGELTIKGLAERMREQRQALEDDKKS